MLNDSDDSEIHHWENEGGCVAHPDGEHMDQERAGVHMRPDVELAAASRPEPSDPVEAALWTFAKMANCSLLHPEDDRRFEEFATLAAEARWTSTEVEAKLVNYGLPAELAQHLRRLYWNRVKPMPMAGTGRRELNEEIAKMNAKLTRPSAGSN